MLPIGKYTLREETAPDGYLVAEDVKFTVKDTGEIQKVVMKDEAKPEETPTETPTETPETTPTSETKTTEETKKPHGTAFRCTVRLFLCAGALISCDTCGLPAHRRARR